MCLDRIDAAEDHRQLSRADARRGVVRHREAERALLESAQVEREAVALPGENLQPIAALVAEDEQVAGERVAFEAGLHDGREAVETLAAIDR